MAALSKLKPGQILWSVESQKMGNTTISRKALHHVTVIEVHADHAICSWNGNTPRKWSIKNLARLRVSKPKPKGKICGMDTY